MTLNETVDKAIEILETGGWCRWRLENSHGEHCMLGALIEAAPDQRLFGRICARLRERLGVQAPVSTIGTWNDKPYRTVKEVLAALKSVKDPE